MNASTLGRTLARRRLEAGLTQAEVAARIGTNQSAVSRLESGRTMPSTEAIDRFALAIGRPIEIVFGAASTPIPRELRRRRVEVALGRDAFDPWDRDPTPTEIRSLNARGLTRERSESSTAARRSE